MTSQKPLTEAALVAGWLVSHDTVNLKPRQLNTQHFWYLFLGLDLKGRVCTYWCGSFEGTGVEWRCLVTRRVLVFTRDTCSSHTSTDSRCWSGAVLGPGVGPRCGLPAFFSSPLHSHCGASAQTQREREREKKKRELKDVQTRFSFRWEVETHVVQLEGGCECDLKMRGGGATAALEDDSLQGVERPPLAGSQVPFNGYDTFCSCVMHLKGRCHGHTTHNNGQQQVEQPGGS